MVHPGRFELPTARFVAEYLSLIHIFAVVSLVSILGAAHGIGHAYSILEILAISVPASLCGVIVAALWSLRRGKDLDKDPEFQAKVSDPKPVSYTHLDVYKRQG